MKLKMQVVLNSQQALSQLAQFAFSATVSYRLSKNLRLAQQEFKHFDEARITALKRLGVLNETKTDYDLTPEARVEFDAEIARLLESEVEIMFLRVPIHMLGNAQIPPAAIGALADVIIVDEHEQPEAKDPTTH